MAREKGPTLTERVQDHYENDFEYPAFTRDVVRKGILRVIEAKKVSPNGATQLRLKMCCLMEP